MYIVSYWLKGQSRLFSEPQKVNVMASELNLVKKIAAANGYEIVKIEKANREQEEENRHACKVGQN